MIKRYESELQVDYSKQKWFFNKIIIFTILVAVLYLSLINYELIEVIKWDNYFYIPLVCVCFFIIFEISILSGMSNKLDKIQNDKYFLNVLISSSDLERVDKGIGFCMEFISSELPMSSKNAFYSYYMNELYNRSYCLKNKRNKVKLKQITDKAKKRASTDINKKLETHPLLKLEKLFYTNIDYLELKKVELQGNWEKMYENLTWWGQLNCDTLNTSEIDNAINDMQIAQNKFKINYQKDVDKIRSFYNDKYKQIISRIHCSYLQSYNSLDLYPQPDKSPHQLAYIGLFGGVFGMSASIFDDLYSANNIYGVLRDVNNNFSEMSDLEIWWDCLCMPPESLAGLVSLTKGAYFEQLVADQTGGQLHEYFNHPDTDIIIDGTAYQLKATDSVGYINSVDDDIPVISTTEIAAQTDAIDSGISNLDITESTIDALGGSVIDFSDMALSGVVEGLGFLGLFATLKGINHASETYNENGDAETAVGEGIELAVMGTLKGVVDTSELAYKVATAKPVKAVGKGVLNLAIGTGKWLDKKITEAENKH